MAAQSEITIIETAEKAIPRITRGEITTRVIRTIAEIEEIRPVWEKWSVHPNSDIDFYLTNLRNEPGNPEPYIIVAYRNGEPQCMLVGRVSRRPIECKVGYKTLFRPQARIIGFVYAGLLGEVDSNASRALVVQINKSLERTADAAFLNFLPSEGMLSCDARQMARWWAKDRFPKAQIHRARTLPRNSADFRRALSANERRNQKRRLRKIADDFGDSLRLSCYQSLDELQTLFADSETVAASGYQRALGVGFANTEHLRQLLTLECKRRALRGYVLYIADRPCAFWVGTVYKGTFNSDYMGYDPAYSKYSPGNVVTIDVVERLCDSGDVDRIDFGLGDAEWKQKLADCEWQEASCYLFGRTSTGLWLNALRTPVMFADLALRRLLQKSTWITKIKSKWRRQLIKEESR